MIFKGISLKFSTKNQEQYENIGRFWDYCSEIYGRENLRGLGYNWTKETLEYVIGLSSGEQIPLDKMLQFSKDAVAKEVFLPGGEWQEYVGKTSALSVLYENIYEEGAPTFEIETFTEQGDCKIWICREYFPFLQLKEKDLPEILMLYKSAIGSFGCVWDEHYPNEQILLEDIRHGDLYGIQDDNGKFIAAVAKDRDPEIDALDCWSSELFPSAELARLVVAEKYKNQGMARILLRLGMKMLQERGFLGIHFLVAVDNERAIRSYRALEFAKVGETDLFHKHYHCYEKAL